MRLLQGSRANKEQQHDNDPGVSIGPTRHISQKSGRSIGQLSVVIVEKEFARIFEQQRQALAPAPICLTTLSKPKCAPCAVRSAMLRIVVYGDGDVA
jgi:hypothetical protein